MTPEMDVLELKLREIQNDKEKAVKAADLSMAKELQARQREIEAEIAGYKEKEERRKLISRNTEKSGRFGGRSIFIWRRENTNYCAKNPDAVHNRIGIKHVRISI